MTRIVRYRTNKTARHIAELATIHNRGDIDVTAHPPTTQWVPGQQLEFVLSLLMDAPIGSLVLNNRLHDDYRGQDATDTRRAMFGMIDGRQRLATLTAFLNSELPVPADWFDTDELAAPALADTVTFTALSTSARRKIGNLTICVEQVVAPTVDAERELFYRTRSAHTPRHTVRFRDDIDEGEDITYTAVHHGGRWHIDGVNRWAYDVSELEIGDLARPPHP